MSWIFRSVSVDFLQLFFSLFDKITEKRNKQKQVPRFLNFFMLNAAEHEIYPAHKC